MSGYVYEEVLGIFDAIFLQTGGSLPVSQQTALKE